jgi:hypothetical protein
MVETFGRHLRNKLKDVFRAADVHPEDVVAILFREIQRSRAMPDFVCGLRELLRRGIVQIKAWPRNIALENVKPVEKRTGGIVGSGDGAQSFYDTRSRRGGFR